MPGQAGTAPNSGATPAAARTVALNSAAGSTATTRTVVSAPDHSESWRRLAWAVFWLVAAIVAVSWYVKRKPEPPPAPAVAAPSAKRAPVQVEVVETPALAVLPAAPAIAAPAADVVVVKPVEPSKGRVAERVADEFRGADRDGDGYLVPAEVEGRFPFIAKEFAKVDRDGDRRISFDEFAELRRQQFERRPLSR